MMKKIITLFIALLAGIVVADAATDYVGNMTVATSRFSTTKEGVVLTVTPTGNNLYSVTFSQLSFAIFGREVPLGERSFENLNGTTGRDGFTSITATLQMSLSELFLGFDSSELFDLIGDRIGDLFSGREGMINPSTLFAGKTYPVMINCRFNEEQMTATLTANFYYELLGREIINETAVVFFEGTVPPPPEPALYLIGSFNDWDEATKVPLTLSDGKWTVTQRLPANAEFKFMDEYDTWLGGVSDGNFLVTKEQVLDGTPLSMAAEGGMNFQIPVAGRWTLTVDKENLQLVVSGKWREPGEIDDVFILGEVNGNHWAANMGVPMVTDDGEIYTATITADGRNDGYNYFSFSTRLAQSVSDWSSISSARFGAVSEGDFWVTPELLGQEIALTAEGGQALKIGKGRYDLTLNLDQYTLVIAQGDLRGDLNDDGIVDVTDVNMIIDMVLGKTEPDMEKADLDGNGLVDVADVNALIDIVLGKA